MVKGACVVKGGMRGEGGGMHGKGGACVAKGGMCDEGGGYEWRKGGGMCGMHAPLYEIWPINARVVYILLECILVCQ